MNCKQGDLAIISKGPLRGMPVTVGQPYINRNGNSAWYVSPKLQGFKGVADHCLDPIKPPQKQVTSTQEIREQGHVR
jgi:hypothetical protein